MKYAKGIEDRLIEAAEERIIRLAEEQSAREPLWDGVCGLVKVCDEEIVANPREEDFRGDITEGTAAKFEEVKPPRAPGRQVASTKAEGPSIRPGGHTTHQLLQQLSRLRGALLQGGDTEGVQKQLAQLADVAFRSGKAAAADNNLDEAINLLLLAREACPASRTKAQSKIDQTLAALRLHQGPCNVGDAGH
eukprot:jgi/Botrbrau1/16447/Bobra.0142s0043.1